MLFDIVIWSPEPSYIQIVYESFISENFLICKLVHTFRDNKYFK